MCVFNLLLIELGLSTLVLDLVMVLVIHMNTRHQIQMIKAKQLRNEGNFNERQTTDTS